MTVSRNACAEGIRLRETICNNSRDKILFSNELASHCTRVRRKESVFTFFPYPRANYRMRKFFWTFSIKITNHWCAITTWHRVAENFLDCCVIVIIVIITRDQQFTCRRGYIDKCLVIVYIILYLVHRVRWRRRIGCAKFANSGGRGGTVDSVIIIITVDDERL